MTNTIVLSQSSLLLLVPRKELSPSFHRKPAIFGILSWPLSFGKPDSRQGSWKVPLWMVFLPDGRRDSPERPKYIGLSCTTASMENAARIARVVKEKSPETLVLAGGPHVTALPEETFRRFPEIDFWHRGEGEAALLDLLEALEGGRNLYRVESAVYREGEAIRIKPPPEIHRGSRHPPLPGL